MMKFIQIEKSFFIIFLILISEFNLNVYSQDTYRIFLKDKGERFKSESEIKNEITRILTPRCLQRRSKVLPLNNLFTNDDLPVFKPYLNEIANTGAELLAELRWQNYCVVLADKTAIENIKNLEFVQSIQPTSSKFIKTTIEVNQIKNRPILNKITNDTLQSETKFNYGNSLHQIEMLGIDKLQSLGFTGDGVLIGFLDAGFRWRQHKSLRKAKVIGEYDFVEGDSLTYNDSTDIQNQDAHGTLVLSTVAGNSNGELIGTAPNANYLLAKTESLKFERRIEEDFFAAGVEWMESQGADVVNASLGYKNFDSTNESYTNDDLNGTFTICDKVVNTAFEHGMVFVNAAGNNGGDSSTLNTPGDAYGSFTIGSVDFNGADVSVFSSKGPNSLGMIKPEFVAFGNNAVCASPYDSTLFTTAKGTSISSPLLAGSIGLILSIYPQITPLEMDDLLKSVSSFKNQVDNRHGWGIPNIFEAVKKYGIAISPLTYYRSLNFQRLVVNILSSDNLIKHKIYIKFETKPDFIEYELTKSGKEYQYYVDIPLENFSNKPGLAYIIANNLQFESRLPYQRDSLITILPYETFIQQGIDSFDLPKTVFSTNRSFIYPSIINNDVTNLKINIFLNKIGDFELKIFDCYGNNIENMTKYTDIEGFYRLDLNISKLASGAYFVMILKPDEKEILKFLLSR